MAGIPKKLGIMFLSTNDLFKKIQENTDLKDYVVKVSYLEIYNE
jgi:hypothetical protein